MTKPARTTADLAALAKLRTAAEHAAAHLEEWPGNDDASQREKAYRIVAELDEALRALPAIVAAEPVAWRYRDKENDGLDEWHLVHRKPPQHTWNEVEPLYTRSPGYAQAIEDAAKVAENAKERWARDCGALEMTNAVAGAGFDLLEAVAVAIRSLSSPSGDAGASDWQAAETAPMWDWKGRPPYVTVFNGNHVGVGYRTSPNYSDDPEWCDETGEFIEPPVTHWMPLPLPPDGSPRRQS